MHNMNQPRLAVRSATRPTATRSRLTILLSLVLAMLLVEVSPRRADAQGRRRSSDVLKSVYFATFPALYDGDYREAQQGFKRSLVKAIKTTEARWIDSICYFAMAGETAYQVGNNAEALEYFTASLRLVDEYSDWMNFVDFRPLQPDAGARAAPPWGKSKRTFRLARYPDTYSIERSRMGVTAQDGQRAITKEASYMPLHVAEMIRCTALSIRRRMELLGPLSESDSLTSVILVRMSERAGPPNHWSNAWLDLQQGLAMVASGKAANGRPFLERAIVAAGEYDHPLTCVAFLELGKLAFHEGSYESASTYLAEASYSAYYFENPLVIEEALRYGYLVHLATQQKGPFPPLQQALAWAQRKRLGVLEASLAVLACEHAVTTGDTRSIKAMLQRAIRAVGSRNIAASRLGARFNYVQAMAALQSGDERVAEESLAAAMQFMRNGSVRLYQITLASKAYVGQQKRGRAALELFRNVLGDPPAVRWRHEPLEALALTKFHDYETLHQWFELAVESGEDQDNVDEAIEIADQARRWRFYDTLSGSGRELSLRWLLGAPEQALSKSALLQKNDLVGRYPMLDQLQKQSETLLTDLRKLPLAPEDQKEFQQQQSLLGELTKTSEALDAAIRTVSLRREPIEMIFPPRLKMSEMTERLGPKQAVLAFFQMRRTWHAFLIMKKGQRHWKIAKPKDLQKHFAALHRGLGNIGSAGQLDYKHLAGDKWKKPALRLTQALMQDSHISLDKNIDELIVVPDGVLWYLPFELLQIGPDKKTQTLASTIRVRYAPTVSLTAVDGRPRRRAGAAAIVAGKILARDDDELARKEIQRLAKVLPRAEVLTDRPAAPSNLLAKSLDALIVQHSIEPEENPYDTAPWQTDRNRNGSRLGDWFAAPLGAPELVVWPGFKTPAESGLKGMSRDARPGDDLFFSICGLMSAGTRSMLISRWRTGGRTSQELLRQYLQELPRSEPGDAWQRSVEIAKQSSLDSSLEPRVREDREDRDITAEHPIFWSGFMVVDNTGQIAGGNAAGAGGDGANDDGVDDEERPGFEFPNAGDEQ